MDNEIIKQLQEQLKELETKHKKFEVTVKEWNEKRRYYDNLIREAESEMLKLRVEAWRRYRDIENQLEINF